MKKGFVAKRILSLLLVFTLLLSTILYGDAVDSYNETSQQVGPNTHYKNATWTTSNGVFKINMVETIIGNQYIKIETSDNGKAVGTESVSKQAQRKYSDSSRVIGAINGDFFYTNELRGLPSGTSIIDGEVKTALPESKIFGVSEKGNCFIDNLQMNAFAYIKDKTYPIVGINRVRWDNQLILYTPAFASLTNTMGNGTEVIVKGIELPIKANGTYTGYVYAIAKDVRNTEIPEDGVVLSGSGTAAEFLNQLNEGDEVSFNVSFSRDNIKYAVSGNARLLKDKQIATDEIEKVADGKTRHPRTAIGIKGGTVVMVTVDGRQKGYSDGMTLNEFANFLLNQGIENALNLDGGGSTSMIVRTQGSYGPILVNSPSDGRERNISNSIQIVSYAPLSEPLHVRFNQSTLNIYKNSTFKLTAYAMDQYFNRVDVASNAINYKLSPGIGKMDKEGVFTAASKAGKGYIEGSSGGTSSRVEVQVYDKVASLKILNNYVSLDPGQQVQLQVKAYNEQGQEIIISPSAVSWHVTGDIGTVDKNGVFTAGKTETDGSIVAKVDTVVADIQARVGNTPVVLENFESMEGIQVSSIRAAAAGNTATGEEPVKMGDGALKLEYNMLTGEEGTAAAYVNLISPMKVPGKPLEIGLWVYGDGSGHWLRGVYTNSAGEKKIVDFTKQGGFNWKGWKYVYAEIPQDEKFPIAFEQVYIAEPMEGNKTEGTVYFDNLTALYKEGPDIYSPEVVSVRPSINEQLTEQPAEIVIKVKDKGTGIDPDSIRFMMDNVQLKSVYNPETGEVIHKVDYKMIKGQHTVRLFLKDKAGNTINPEFRFTFSINPETK